MKSVKFLEEVKEKLQLRTDAELAKTLNVTKAAVSQYMSGKRIIENETCVAVALLLEIEPWKVIMAADIDRAERSGQKSLWEVFSKRMALAPAILAVTSVNLFLTPAPAEAAPVLKDRAGPVCIMLNLCRIVEALRAISSPSAEVKVSQIGK